MSGGRGRWGPLGGRCGVGRAAGEVAEGRFWQGFFIV
jgi:hypothetical protein